MRLTRLTFVALTPLAITIGISVIPAPADQRPHELTVIAMPATTTTTTVPAPVLRVWRSEDRRPQFPGVMVPAHALCRSWWLPARAAGWPVDALPYLDRVLFGESRCQPNVHYAADPNSGSYGLTQINGYWCRKNLYNPHKAGWLGARLAGFTGCEDLFDPVTNLQAAWLIWQYADSRGCGWSPWSTASRKWCD